MQRIECTGRRVGFPTKMKKVDAVSLCVSMPAEDWFWARVCKTDTCWLWDKPNCDGYGAFWWNGRTRSAHRIALELHLGRPIKKGLVVAHDPIICKNKACVNPAHLREATYTENALDKRLEGTIVRRSMSDDQIREIRILASEGLHHTQIAKQLGIKSTPVRDVLRGNIGAYVV